MTAKNSAWLSACCAAVLLMCLQPPLVAEEELPPLTTTVQTEEALAAIKRRAQKVLEARRQAQREARRLRFFGQASVVAGYETNSATSGARKGDTYVEENLYLMLSKKLNPAWEWSGSYYGAYDKYLDYGDGDYTSHTLTPVKLKWQPGRTWRLESWIDLDYNYYPTAQDSRYRQFKTASRARQNLFGTAYHQVQYEWFAREYTARHARDGAGANTLTKRHDTRHKLKHKIGMTFKEGLLLKNALVSLENQWYWNDSNDAGSADFYDYDVWKISTSFGGYATPKLHLNSTVGFERKNYSARQVTGHGITTEARYDDKYSVNLTASYTLSKMWKVGTGLSYDHLDSNEPTGEYDNTKYTMTLTATF